MVVGRGMWKDPCGCGAGRSPLMGCGLHAVLAWPWRLVCTCWAAYGSQGPLLAHAIKMLMLQLFPINGSVA